MTTDITLHYIALRDLAELAESGIASALSGFASLLDPRSDPIRQLPWTHKNDERAQWFRKAERLQRTRLRTDNSTEEKEQACEQLEAMLRPTVALTTKGEDWADGGFKQRNRADSDSSRSSGNNSLQTHKF